MATFAVHSKIGLTTLSVSADRTIDIPRDVSSGKAGPTEPGFAEIELSDAEHERLLKEIAQRRAYQPKPSSPNRVAALEADAPEGSPPLAAHVVVVPVGDAYAERVVRDRKPVGALPTVSELVQA